MARKGLTGQLNMFDLFKSMENVPMGEVQMVSLMPEDEPEELEQPQVEELPWVEEVPQVEEVFTTEEKIVKTPRKVVKSKRVDVPREQERPREKGQPQEQELPREKEQPRKKEVVHQNDKPAMSRQYIIDGKDLEIAYINYNKVRITREGEEPEVYLFESSKEAVDFYVQKMQELEPEE